MRTVVLWRFIFVIILIFGFEPLCLSNQSQHLPKTKCILMMSPTTRQTSELFVLRIKEFQRLLPKQKTIINKRETKISTNSKSRSVLEFVYNHCHLT